MLKEFKEFILKGNLLQMAVAFIMGGAFGEVTKAFTGIVTGLLGLMGGQPDFSGFAPGGVLVGVFLNTLVNLLIVGFCLFLVVKAYNRLMLKPKEADPKPAADPPDIKLL